MVGRDSKPLERFLYFFGHESDLNYFKLPYFESLFLLFWRRFYWYGVDSKRQDAVFFKKSEFPVGFFSSDC